jgi:GTPase SAR1 family protein
MGGGGKTTILETLYNLTKEKKKDIVPIGNLIKIGSASGATLYFDRGLFQSINQKKIFYRVFAVAGQKSFSPLRKKIFEGSDGVIFVIDSQVKFLEDNIESLKELKKVSEDNLIKEYPLIIMLNKQDLDDVIGKEDFKQILKEEGLWYETQDKLSVWNPLIYETCALYNKQDNIYRSFSECARRTALYQIYGDGSAPVDQEELDISLQHI